MRCSEHRDGGRSYATVTARPSPRAKRRDSRGYLFGSTARRSIQPHSDLDIAVYLAEPRPQTSPFGYAADLSAELMRVLVLRAWTSSFSTRRHRFSTIACCATECASWRATCGPPPPARGGPSRGTATTCRILRRSRPPTGRVSKPAVRSLSPGKADPAVVRRHLLAIDAAVQRLRRHAGRPLSALAGESDAQ